MNTELNEAVQVAANELRSARQNGDQIVRAFLSELASGLTKWLPEVARVIAAEQHEVTKELGIEGIKRFKKDLADFISVLPSVLEPLSRNNVLWAHDEDFKLTHRGVINQAHYYRLSERPLPPRPLVEAIGQLLNAELVQTFSSYSFSWHRSGTNRLFEEFPWSGELLATLQPYSAVIGRVVEANRQLTQAKEARDRAAATDLWDKS